MGKNILVQQNLKDKNISVKSKIIAYIKQNKKLILWESVGLIFCLAMSFVFHFAYEWLGKSNAGAFLFATNESVWEHSKLIFYPFFIYSIAEYLIIKPNAKVFLYAKCLPLVICIPAMLAIFYTYSGIIGTNILAVDICITIAIVFGMNYLSYNILAKQTKSKYYIFLAIATVLLLILLVVFTYFPPHINLFLDKTTNKYGVMRSRLHSCLF